MKGDDGYTLINSLLTLALILICIAAFFALLAVSVRQSGHIGTRIEKEMLFRNEKTMEQLK